MNSLWVDLVDKENPSLWCGLVAGFVLDLMYPIGIEVVAIPVVEMAVVSLFPDEDVILIQGAYGVYGLAFQNLIIADDLGPDLVVKQVQQGDFVIPDGKAHELLKEIGFYIVDLKTVVPEEISILVESNNDGVGIAVAVEDLIAPYEWIAGE